MRKGSGSISEGSGDATERQRAPARGDRRLEWWGGGRVRAVYGVRAAEQADVCQNAKERRTVPVPHRRSSPYLICTFSPSSSRTDFPLFFPSLLYSPPSVSSTFSLHTDTVKRSASPSGAPSPAKKPKTASTSTSSSSAKPKASGSASKSTSTSSAKPASSFFAPRSQSTGGKEKEKEKGKGKAKDEEEKDEEDEEMKERDGSPASGLGEGEDEDSEEEDREEKKAAGKMCVLPLSFTPCFLAVLLRRDSEVRRTAERQRGTSQREEQALMTLLDERSCSADIFSKSSWGTQGDDKASGSTKWKEGEPYVLFSSSPPRWTIRPLPTRSKERGTTCLVWHARRC